MDRISAGVGGWKQDDAMVLKSPVSASVAIPLLSLAVLIAGLRSKGVIHGFYLIWRMRKGHSSRSHNGEPWSQGPLCGDSSCKGGN